MERLATNRSFAHLANDDRNRFRWTEVQQAIFRETDIPRIACLFYPYKYKKSGESDLRNAAPQVPGFIRMDCSG